MKKFLSVSILILIAAASMAQTWEKNFEIAKERSAREGKNIVLCFSGSDWCIPCIKLEKTIWESKEFASYSQAHFVLLMTTRASVGLAHPGAWTPSSLPATADMSVARGIWTASSVTATSRRTQNGSSAWGPSIRRPMAVMMAMYFHCPPRAVTPSRLVR